MQRRRGTPPPPSTMIFLREALANSTLSYNKEGELVKQAFFRWRRGSEVEKFVVTSREGAAMFFHLRWDDDVRQGVGDWVGVNALAGGDLEELYDFANNIQKEILDNSRWNPI